MKIHGIGRAAWALSAMGVAAMAPLAAQAQAANDKWQWELAIYGWFPAIGGSTSFPSTGASGPNIDVTASDVIDALKMVFMGQAEVRKDRWGLWTDLVYADLGGSKGGSRNFTVDGHPVSVTADLSLDVKSTVWTLAGLYNLTFDAREQHRPAVRRAHAQHEADAGLVAGQPPSPSCRRRSGQASVDGTDWDAIVGLKGRYYFGAERKWFLPYYVDVGTGQSKLTWQVNAGVGYQFDWGSVFATWRYLDYDFKSGNALQSMNMNGALIGVAFQFWRVAQPPSSFNPPPTKDFTMIKQISLAAAALAAGVALAQQFPILDNVADKVIQKYQASTCEQLWAQKQQPKSEPRSNASIGLLKSDPQCAPRS